MCMQLCDINSTKVGIMIVFALYEYPRYESLTSAICISFLDIELIITRYVSSQTPVDRRNNVDVRPKVRD